MSENKLIYSALALTTVFDYSMFGKQIIKIPTRVLPKKLVCNKGNMATFDT